MNVFMFAALSMGVVAVALAVVIYIVSRKFQVDEDPRIKEVQALLPGSNCGGCGFAGCQALAAALVEGADKKSLEGLYCPPGGAAVNQNVADFLGMVAVNTHKRVAVLRCGGSCAASPSRIDYQGPASCTVAHGLFSGEGGCAFGCLGQGECVAACTFGAMRMDETTGLPVVDPVACTACGACVKACPRSLLQLRPYGKAGARVWVNCRNTEKGAVSRKNCSVSCIGCGKCVKICADIAQAITMENNLAYIDPSKCTACGACVGECPTGAILASPAVKLPAKAARAAKESEQ